MSCFTGGQNHSRGWGEGTAGASLGQAEPKHRHSALQGNYMQFATTFNSPQSRRLLFLQHKVGCSMKEAENRGKRRMGNSVYQWETGKARKQNPTAWRMRLPEAGYLYSDSFLLPKDQSLYWFFYAADSEGQKLHISCSFGG